jgi:hypothetical protein
LTPNAFVVSAGCAVGVFSVEAFTGADFLDAFSCFGFFASSDACARAALGMAAKRPIQSEKILRKTLALRAVCLNIECLRELSIENSTRVNRIESQINALLMRQQAETLRMSAKINTFRRTRYQKIKTLCFVG